ncbi:hypothetical protein QBC46DRAFT_432756 [Diplogelasinospora grovesii]|uniref:DUF7730 domain-containing protein n=1 Tax=Diplogelasinospora grovesii TaxID=303347 RepID=A0AAN6S4N0_9PEZI|nr:hypothetical protein QBC46DRAFT_432756 [Diplogelasinospora grovesii]
MTMPFRRQDIAKAFFGLDLSDTKSLLVDSNRPTPSRRDPQATIRSPTTNETNPKPALLALPAEIRLQIYDLLLVSRFNREQNPSWAVGNTCQKMVILHMIQAPQYRTMEPAILRTCRQIYREAISVLYSGNVFNLSEPEQMFRFMAQIGPINIKLVRSLDVWIPWMADVLPWLTLLNALSKEAAGLKYIELGWGADCEFPWMLERGAKERGWGDNVLFIRALAKIQGLEKIHIKGYYAKHWPSYLMAKTSAQVQAECGQYHEPGPDDDPKTIQWIQELNESNLRSFREYQKGTEDLVP